MTSELRFWVEAAVVRMFVVGARYLPRGLILAMGSLAGDLGRLLDGRHRRIAAENLRNALGAELSAKEMRKTLRACWRHFGRITLDTLTFPRLNPEWAARSIRYEGLEHIQGAYHAGRGVLLFSAHFGHWELIAYLQGFLDLPLALVTRPLDNPHLEILLADLRGGSGNRIIHKRRAMREMLQALRAKIGVAILIDQSAGVDGVFVPFFGRPASTTPSLALMALRTGAVIIPTFSVPQSDGGYRIVYEPPVRVLDTGDRAGDVRRITEQCTAIIERWVRRHPELWLWMHRRWKSAPATAVASDRLADSAPVENGQARG